MEQDLEQEFKDKSFFNLMSVKEIFTNNTRTEFITIENGTDRPSIKMVTFDDVDMSNQIWEDLFQYLEYDEDGDVSSYIDILEDIGIEIVDGL